MLIRFILENFSSYKKSAEFSMLPGKVRRMKDHLINAGNINLLKCGVLYGANASGKSNIIKAIKFSSDIILKGIENIDAGNKHFRLEKEYINEPSIFQYEISINKEVYSYGFATLLSEKRIIEEWLYLKKEKNEKCIFDREISEGETVINTDLRFNSSEYMNRFSVYIDDMKRMPKKLFLSEIANKNIEDIQELNIFKEIYNWFKYKLILIFPESKFLGLNRVVSNIESKKQFHKYLEYFDTGITDLRPKKVESEEFLKTLPEDLRIDLNNMEKEETTYFVSDKVYSIEKDTEGDIIINRLGIEHNNYKDLFDLEDESDGTVRLFDLIPVFSLLSKDSVIIIDEIDRSLHPKLTVEFIKLFYKLSEGNKSQLILTTHESHLLDLNLFRRDEIWFVEKRKDSSSKLYSLDMFQDRYDKKVEKDYLIGRYGAIPIFSNFKSFSTRGEEDEPVTD